jgi:thiomorpholine-carboxylate dehydrogenase
VVHLDESDVRAVLHWEQLIPAMESALAAFSAGRVIQLVRNMITIEEGRRYLGIMPCATEAAMGLKLVSFYPGNAGTAFPTHLAMILLFDPDTGQPLALMDGRLITEMRTAAVSAAVTKRLAAPGSRTLALLGSGVQAKAHLEALSRVRRFDDVRVWSRTPGHARRFAAEHGARAMDAESAVRGADVVVTATNALEEVMANVLVVDSREAVLKESGDVILSRATIHAEVGEIFAGVKTIPVSETTVFKSVGLAIEDLTTGRLVYDTTRARRSGGRVIAREAAGGS